MRYTSTPKRVKAKKAKHYQAVQCQAEKRIRKGEQKRLHEWLNPVE
ncbi:hypothetical protein uav_005 [Pseudomonas phage UAVern]|uniref:Uncharacterized protein n=1 Tax=Pseudomonas phage UAVern TaxID=2856997 RepID=A0A975YZ57_9CAUD|nr:hypothetical protein uav_005 [Pseudomonas phage UAVern]